MGLLDLISARRGAIADEKTKLRDEYKAILARAADPEAADGRRLSDLAQELGISEGDLSRDVEAASRLAEINKQIPAAEQKLRSLEQQSLKATEALEDLRRQIRFHRAELAGLDDKRLNSEARAYREAASLGVILAHQDAISADQALRARGWFSGMGLFGWRHPARTHGDSGGAIDFTMWGALRTELLVAAIPVVGACSEREAIGAQANDALGK